ncbi:hypothetical protein [Phocoenobacter skyensis]|uniref:Uncharacterized protein n=1 Tax=Phocoenobacter skyensis TaxID=97481 RepID=A0A1H7XG27_9PAST|nr:hypothetical protein [Pasteurella skyensis]MDP8079704.1 hypothetical protein [Pasteurella skyensis]MDP8085596.1 hypothetical protein [Pasteurella skyensis]MDP8185423.1 hypothetical protein [Pasteurella skyensis]QLB22186.1 hypothetical protein A6B44_02820 [Pasteurella skyensis]SEM32746.1 hypothetical protein SAMN05444853_11268 [Pasteurella skyensis]
MNFFKKLGQSIFDENKDIVKNIEDIKSNLSKTEENIVNINQNLSNISDSVEGLNKSIKNLFSTYSVYIILGITVGSAILGGFIIYVHLSRINALSLFPDLIDSRNIFISMTISCISIISIFILLSVVYSFILNKCHTFFKEKYDIAINNKIGIFCIISIFIIYFYFFSNLKLIYHIVFLSVPTIFLLSYFLYYYKNIYFLSGFSLKLYMIIDMMFCIPLFFIISWVTSYIFRIYLNGDDNYFMIIFIINYLFMLLLYYFPLVSFFMSCLLFFLFIVMIILVPLHFSNLKYISPLEFSLEKLGVLERINQSQWYLIDKRFIQNKYSYLAPDSNFYIDVEKVERLKNKFGNSKGKCSKEHISKNALCGYFAWNLGEEKVFCPSHIDNTAKINAKQECLLIEGKYLTQSLN